MCMMFDAFTTEEEHLKYLERLRLRVIIGDLREPENKDGASFVDSTGQ